MTFQAEPWWQAESEIRKLVDVHWRELAVFQDRMKLAIKWAHYRELDQRVSMPILQLTTARTMQRELAGYWINVINTHPHYESTVCAFQDSYFLLPQYRKGNTGLALMLEMQANAKLAGAECIIGSDKDHLSMQGLFEYCKFMSPGRQYMKWIGGD